jgi:2-polyprenyl-6-methoxyphenol hydroxylase-like FAD-dependent oxidoreductase
MRVIINGVGIAGPTLAFWLRKAGHEVLLVEAAPALRRGGYVIDFGGVGYDVAEKMGLIPRIRDAGYQSSEIRFVDRRGRKCAGVSVKGFQRLLDGRFTTLRRSDLAALIYAALDAQVETIFGDSVASIEEAGRYVRVGFDHAPPREADLVIGADGLHSRVRRLVFKPDEAVEVSLGYYVAAFEIKGYRSRDELVWLSHAVPGRQISRWSMRDDRTVFLFIFRDEYLITESPSTDQERKAVLAKVFGDVGWECPQILAGMAQVGTIYFDRVSQIRMGRWSKGRTALLGDAAACISLMGGEGTGLAMTEAYVLAGELCQCGGDYAAAFARYEERLRPLLKRKQKLAARFGAAFVPKTRLGIAIRNLIMPLLGLSFVVDFLFRRELREEIQLPDYAF